MAELSVFDYGDGILVVDSCLIAQRLGIEHESFMRTIKNYQTQIEQAFGQFRFEIGTVTNSVGAVNETKYVLLTEDQATALMTFSRNTPEVIQCKIELVKSFSKAKELLRQKQVPRGPYWYERMKVAMSDRCIPYLKERDPQGIKHLVTTLNTMPPLSRRSLAFTLIGRLLHALPPAA